MLRFASDELVSLADFRRGLIRSTWAARRPVYDPDCRTGMLQHANLLVTCWDAAVEYSPHVGFEPHPQAWVLPARKKLAGPPSKPA